MPFFNRITRLYMVFLKYTIGWCLDVIFHLHRFHDHYTLTFFHRIAFRYDIFNNQSRHWCVDLGFTFTCIGTTYKLPQISFTCSNNFSVKIITTCMYTVQTG